MNFQALCLAHIIQTHAKSGDLIKGKQLHARLIRTVYPLTTFLINHLLNFYSKCGHLNYALSLFETMPQRNLVTWTAMISGFAQNSHFSEAVETFRGMIVAGESPNQFAFSSVLQACSGLGSIEYGKQVHSVALKNGFGCELFVGSNLADMYSKCGVMVDSCKVFEEMPDKDEVSWTAMIDGYGKSGDFEAALIAYKRMINDDNVIVIDQHVLCSSLSACGALKFLIIGKCLHSSIIKLGFESGVSVFNALTDMYSKSRDVESALRVLEGSWSCRNIMSYTSLIDGYVEMDQIENAFLVFKDLRREGVEPNEFTFSSLVKACANKAELELGTQLHAKVMKFNLENDPFVSSVLVDMYGKCGLLDDSIRFFNEIGENPNEIAWNSILSVLAQHGLGREVIEVFGKMVDKGIKPNEITFISLLRGCSHGGLVDEGLRFFHSMKISYGVAPTEEHYSCVIDLLGRAGKLKEAEEFIKSMPFEPNAFGWCSFLGSCRIHGDMERGRIAAKKLIKLEPYNSGAHVLLSNIYAKEQQWEDVRSLRKMMRDGNVKKLPGFSWVDVGNKTHMFGSEDWSHPRKKEIYEKLDIIFHEIKEAGYVPDTDVIPLNVEESVKERLLHHHSERIAIAFSLISMPPRKPIIVKKNLRVCSDCHMAIKYISKVVGRKIILRDNSRFHHFEGGVCSCGDYW